MSVKDHALEASVAATTRHRHADFLRRLTCTPDLEYGNPGKTAYLGLRTVIIAERCRDRACGGGVGGGTRLVRIVLGLRDRLRRGAAPSHLHCVRYPRHTSDLCPRFKGRTGPFTPTVG